MISPQAFYDLVRPELPGIFEPMLDAAIVQVARTFCMRTRCWRDDLFSQATVAGQTDYELGANFGEPIGVHSLSVNGNLLFDVDNERAAAFSRFRPPFRLSADFSSITLSREVVPGYSMADGLQIGGILWPAINAALLPDLLLYRYGDDMRVGVLARLLVMGSKPWTDRELSVAYASDFESRLTRAANVMALGNRVGVPLRTKDGDDETELCRPLNRICEEDMATKTLQLLNASAPATGSTLSRSASLWDYVMTVKGDGPVSATAHIDVSIDGNTWLLWGSLSASGVSSAFDSLEPAQGAYPHQRAVLDTITGTNAVVNIVGAGV